MQGTRLSCVIEVATAPTSGFAQSAQQKAVPGGIARFAACVPGCLNPRVITGSSTPCMGLNHRYFKRAHHFLDGAKKWDKIHVVDPAVALL
jgi:hypothetical protein